MCAQEILLEVSRNGREIELGYDSGEPVVGSCLQALPVKDVENERGFEVDKWENVGRWWLHDARLTEGRHLDVPSATPRYILF